MKETGIIMSGNHPAKIQADTKTVTRRTYGLETINKFPWAWELAPTGYDAEKGAWLFWQKHTGEGVYIKCPYGHVGDRLWVRETHFIGGIKPNEWAWYKAGFDGDAEAVVWRPSIHMPRWASRIDLEITGLRAERVQKITEEDAKAEGCISDAELTSDGKDYSGLYAADRFYLLWESLNTKRGYSWEKNNWVWPISFKVVSSG